MFRLLSEVVENCTEVKTKVHGTVILDIFFLCDFLRTFVYCVLLIFRKIAEKNFYTHAVTFIFCNGHLADTFIQSRLQMRNVTINLS